MNYYDAQQVRLRAIQKQPVDPALLAEANAYVAKVRGTPVDVNAPIFIPAAPTMDTPCICGKRYGMHRVNDLACPNPKWHIANGQPQWLTQTYERGNG